MDEIKKSPGFPLSFWGALIAGSWGSAAMLLEFHAPMDGGAFVRFPLHCGVIASLVLAMICLKLGSSRWQPLKRSWIFSLVFIACFIGFFLLCYPGFSFFESKMEEQFDVYGFGEPEKRSLLAPFADTHKIWLLLAATFVFFLHRFATTGKAVFFYVTLAIGAGSAFLPLHEPQLDIRGANLFIRPIQYLGILLTAGATATLFWTLSGFSILKKWPGVSPVLFLVLYIAALFFMIPQADGLAEQYQRLTISNPGDTGYGWFYYDDSGMGNQPSRLEFRTQFLAFFLVRRGLLEGNLELVILLFGIGVFLKTTLFLVFIWAAFQMGNSSLSANFSKEGIKGPETKIRSR